MKTVSVIITTYNRCQSLKRALTSVLAQTVLPSEIIVVDDGSTDSTAAMVEQLFPNVTYLKTKNHGVSHARNQGIKIAKAEWVAFLDSDDEWLPEKLEKQLAFHPENNTRFIHCDEIWVRNGIRVNAKNKHQKRGGLIFEKCLPLCIISPSAVLMQRSLFAEFGFFDEELRACEDYDLWIRLCATIPVYFVNRPLLIKYGGHTDQLSKKYWGMDRFRVYSLLTLLKKQTLLDNQQSQVIKTIKEKCEILAKGAIKRNKQKSFETYQSIIRNPWQASENIAKLNLL